MKRFFKLIPLLLLIPAILAGCGSSIPSENAEEILETPKADDLVTVGFSQLGAESDWRSANTESMLGTFTEENGYDLVYKNGQQKQANQITAIRMFIQQEVDYIVLAPATEDGWDSVLSEARDANIPVIIVDRRVNAADKNLYSCWVGSDFELEGKKMAAWIKAFTENKGIAAEDLHIVNIQGSIGSTAQIGRTRGLANAARENGWDLMAEVSGDFTDTTFNPRSRILCIFSAWVQSETMTTSGFMDSTSSAPGSPIFLVILFAMGTTLDNTGSSIKVLMPTR